MIGLKDAYIFLSTEIENAGALSYIGNLGLAPMRYLCGGKTISLQTPEQKITIHSVASFHESGRFNASKSLYRLKSSQTHMIKAILSVFAVVPGLLLALVKLVDYGINVETRKKHLLVKEHLTPMNREIGSVKQPITTDAKLREALDKVWDEDTMHRPTEALIIHGDGNLELNADPGILQFNPMKLILEGAQIVHKPCPSIFGRLIENMNKTHKWKNVWKMPIATVEDALKIPLRRREWLTCKCFHQVIYVPRPASAV